MLFIGSLGMQDRGRQQVAVATKLLKRILNMTFSPQQVVATHPFDQGFEVKAHICERVIQDSYTFLISCLLNASQHHDWVFLLLLGLQWKLRTQILYSGLPEVWGNCYHMIIYTFHQELTKSVDSHGSLSLQFMIKLMI
jgi:hypothetical protein